MRRTSSPDATRAIRRRILEVNKYATILGNESDDATTISLLYANQAEADILERDALDELASAHPERLRVWYTVDRAPEGWKYSIGFINEDMLRQHLPAASEQTYIFMCGPPPMLKFACRPNLDKLGHAESHVLAF